MTHLLDLVWANREAVFGIARKLKLSASTWLGLLAIVVIGALAYLAVAYGYRFNPNLWTPAQWAQLVVNLAGLLVLFLAQRLWWNRQDQVWDEVDELRSELDKLREEVYGSRADTTEFPTVQRALGGRTFSFRD